MVNPRPLKKWEILAERLNCVTPETAKFSYRSIAREAETLYSQTQGPNEGAIFAMALAGQGKFEKALQIFTEVTAQIAPQPFTQLVQDVYFNYAKILLYASQVKKADQVIAPFEAEFENLPFDLSMAVINILYENQKYQELVDLHGLLLNKSPKIIGMYPYVLFALQEIGQPEQIFEALETIKYIFELAVQKALTVDEIMNKIEEHLKNVAMMKTKLTANEENSLNKTRALLKSNREFQHESQAWLNSAEGRTSLPPFDWGEEGEPEGVPIRYEPGVGLVAGD